MAKFNETQHRCKKEGEKWTAFSFFILVQRQGFGPLHLQVVSLRPDVQERGEILVISRVWALHRTADLFNRHVQLRDASHSNGSRGEKCIRVVFPGGPEG